MKGTSLESRHCTSGDSTSRLSDAEIIANMLDANRFSAAIVMEFGFGQWHMAALATRVDDPSPETRAMVVQLLQDKEAAHAAAELDLSGTCVDRKKSGVRGFSSTAFDTWLSAYRNRLDQVVKNGKLW
jgi:hypothetical protein